MLSPPGLLTLLSVQLVETATTSQRCQDQQRSLGSHACGPNWRAWKSRCHAGLGHRPILAGRGCSGRIPSLASTSTQSRRHTPRSARSPSCGRIGALGDRSGKRRLVAFATCRARAELAAVQAVSSPSDRKLAKAAATANVSLHGMAPAHPLIGDTVARWLKRCSRAWTVSSLHGRTELLRRRAGHAEGSTGDLYRPGIALPWPAPGGRA